MAYRVTGDSVSKQYSIMHFFSDPYLEFIDAYSFFQFMHFFPLFSDPYLSQVKGSSGS